MQGLAVVGFLVMLVVICLINPLIIYCLWDDTFVKFFGVPDVTFWDAFWISWISAALFKSSNISNSKD